MSVLALGFTLGQAFISFFVTDRPNWYEDMIYHHSYSASFYLLIFFSPLTLGILLYVFLRNVSFPACYQVIFKSVLVIQVSFTIISSSLNYYHWGYFFRRPAVFGEIAQAEKIINCTSVDNLAIRDELGASNGNGVKIFPSSQEDLYEQRSERILNALLYYQKTTGRNFTLKQILNDYKRKTPDSTVSTIYAQIKQTNLLDLDEEGKPHGQLSGFLTTFIALNKKYLAAGLESGEVSNDHFACYEFLFIESQGHYKLCKKQRFYKDSAGIEGFEYANIAPLFSLKLTIITLVSGILIFMINWILK